MGEVDTHVWYKGHKITLKEPIFGIRVWAQFYPNCVPRFEVFDYLGVERKTGHHYFVSRREGTIIGKTPGQLYDAFKYNQEMNFRPLLLDFDKLKFKLT